MMAEVMSVSGRKMEEQSGDGAQFCDVCKEEDQTLAAVGICETCGDSLCEGCFNAHCIPKQTRNHVLKRDVNVDETKGEEAKDISKCKVHEHKKIKYYCEDHDQLGCSQCFVTKHRACGKVVVIADIASKTESDPEFRELERDLAFTDVMILKNKDVIVKLRDAAGKRREKVLADVEEHGVRLKAYIDEFVKKQKAQIDVYSKEDLKKLSDDDMKVEQLESLIQPLNECVISSKKGGNSQNMFIAMKLVRKDVQSIKWKVVSALDATKLRKYSFTTEDRLTKSLKKQSDIGKVARRQFDYLTVAK